MLDLLRAEWIKVVGMRRPIAYLLMIFPIMTVILLMLFFIGLSGPDEAEVMGNWQTQALRAWNVAGHMLTRFFLIAFFVVAFAGEYQWGTWKNITPRRPRSLLLMTKLVVTGFLVAVTFVIESLVLVVGGRVLTWKAGIPYEPGWADAKIGNFVLTYLQVAGITFVSLLILGLFAILTAIYSRTIIGGALAGVVLVFIEGVILLIPPRLAGLLNYDPLVHLGRLLPIYHVENLRSWSVNAEPTTIYDSSYAAFGFSAPADTVATSVVALAAWLSFGITAVCYLFQRQDITS